MTLEGWLAAIAPGDLYNQLFGLTERKLHLLTAAFLRRVWDDLPSHHTRTAVEATEKFADGRITSDELARLRSTDLLESGELLWVDPQNGDYEERIVRGYECPCCEPGNSEFVCRETTTGKGLFGVRAGIRELEWIAVQAAFLARELVAAKLEPEERDDAARTEAAAQFELVREVVGPWVSSRWPEWRTRTVRGVARAIHRDRAFHDLPILADALQDADCDDETVLAHCRTTKEHVRGCWVLDLAMGVA
jgi:hypothetical protein